METCPGEEALAEFASGALAAAEAQLLEAHLAGCGDCSWLVGQLLAGDAAPAGKPAPPEAAEVSGDAPPRYALKGLLGSGGMGTVYEAEDVRLGRRVALKLLRDDPPGPAERTARFLREAHITAMLEHPNIVPVLEVGRLEDGAAYYTQRLVRGRTLSQAIAQCKEASARLALLPHFRDVCTAMAYAHGRGVIHRDLKPTNVMVGEFGETVVVDWGLARAGKADGEPLTAARALAPAGATVDGHIVGTPGYMSPEQAAGRLDEVDERSDVFGLGAMLFEILTGRPPFGGDSAEERLRKSVQGADLETGEGVPVDLAAIARKALSTERERRYPHAGALLADLEAWSAGRRVAAHRYSPAQALRKLALRYRATSAALLVGLALGGAWVGNVWGRRQEQRVAKANELIKRANTFGRGLQWDRMAAYFAAARLFDDTPLARWGLAMTAHLGIEPIYKLKNHAGAVRAVALSPDGAVFASAGDDRTVRLVDAATGAERARWELPAETSLLALAPDARTIYAAAGATLHAFTVGGAAKTAALPAAATALALSIDGARVALAFGAELRLFDARSLAELFRARAPAPVHALATLPSGEVLLGGGDLPGLYRWRPGEGEPLRVEGWASPVQKLSTCDGTKVALLDQRDTAFIEELRGGALPERLDTLSAGCKHITLSRNCRILACTGEWNNVQLIDTQQRLVAVNLAGSYRAAAASSLSADGKLLLLGSADAVRLYSAAEAMGYASRRGRLASPAALAWSPDGALLLSADETGALQQWDPRDGSPLREVAAHVGRARAIAFAGSGAAFATAGDDGVRLFTAELASRPTAVVEPSSAVALSPAGDLIAAGGADGAIRFATDGGPAAAVAAHRGEVRALAFSPDGRRLASAGADGAVLIFDVAARKLAHRLAGHQGEARALAFIEGGARLVSGGADRTLRTWDVASGRALSSDASPWTGEVVAFSLARSARGAPAAGMLLVATEPAELELWRPGSDKAEMAISGNNWRAWKAVAFSPGARRAAFLRTDGFLQLRDMDTIERLGSPEVEWRKILEYYKYSWQGDDVMRDEEALVPPALR